MAPAEAAPSLARATRPARGAGYLENKAFALTALRGIRGARQGYYAFVFLTVRRTPLISA